jgi:hypothetical protein
LLSQSRLEGPRLYKKENARLLDSYDFKF